MRYKLIDGIAAIAATVAVAGMAQAADIAMEPAVHDWSGFYIGGHVGYGEAYYTGFWDGSSDDYFPSDLNLSGIVGGVHAGFNHQMNSLVLGLEADITATDWSDSKSPSVDYETMFGDVNFLASLRGRVGVALDDVLLFATGGVALADASYAQQYDTDPKGKVNFNDIGGVVGGGVEWASSENISWRAEGLYYIFNDRHDTSNLVSSSSTGDHVEFKDAFVIRIGASWYLN